MSTVQQNAPKQNIFKGTAIFLAALCALGGFGLAKQMQIIKRISSENKALRSYARDAQNFTANIKADTLENFEYCNDTNCMTCRAVKHGNEIAIKDYNTSLNTLKIDQRVLSALQKGPSI